MGLAAINRNGQHLATLFEDLLRAVRSSRGGLPVHLETATIAPAVDELLAGRHAHDAEVTVEPTDA